MPPKSEQTIAYDIAPDVYFITRWLEKDPRSRFPSQYGLVNVDEWLAHERLRLGHTHTRVVKHPLNWKIALVHIGERYVGRDGNLLFRETLNKHHDRLVKHELKKKKQPDQRGGAADE